MSVNMDIDSSQSGYGYSVWYVPRNFKELQEKYNISHIPHITLETNLSLRDAYHVYHNANKSIRVKFQDKYVKFPSFYENDPLMSYGWYVDIIGMTRRKLNWTPHMTLRYVSRKNNNTYKDKVILSENLKLSTEIDNDFECDIMIADTRSGVPQEWHTKHKYFNLKITHSNSLSFGLNEKVFPVSTTSIDEYFGTCNEEFNEFKKLLCNELYEKGIKINEKDYINVINAIEKELLKTNNFTTSMEVDNPSFYRIK